MEWKDKTSYSRNDKERVPRILELEVGKLRIVIHRIIYCEGWHLTSRELAIKDRHIDTEDLEEAKNEGLKVIIEKINKLEKIKNIIENKIN